MHSRVGGAGMCLQGVTQQTNNHVDWSRLTGATKQETPNTASASSAASAWDLFQRFQCGDSSLGTLSQRTLSRSVHSSQQRLIKASPRGQKEINFVQHYETKAPISVCREGGAVKQPEPHRFSQDSKGQQVTARDGDLINALSSPRL